MAYKETYLLQGVPGTNGSGQVSPHVWEAPGKLMQSLTGQKIQQDKVGRADEYLDSSVSLK